MSLITLLIAGAITSASALLPASQQLDLNNNVYQTYLPSQKIGMEIFKGDYDNGYKLGIVLYYSNSTYASNSTPWDTDIIVRDWNLKIRANDTIIYETGNIDYGPLIISGSITNRDGESQTLRTNQYNEYTPPLFYFHTVYINDEYILPIETLHYEMNARDYYDAENQYSTIRLTAELETADPIGRDGLWCINLATFKTDDVIPFSYYSAFNTAVYTYNETLDMNSLTTYSQALYIPVAESQKHFTYTTDNSRMRSWFGVSTINENNFYNHIMKTGFTTTYGSENLKTSFTATPNQEQFSAFSIQHESYFYIRYQQQQRTPDRMYIIKDMIKETDESNNSEKSSVLLHEYILEFRYTDKLSGGVPSGGSAGSNNGDYTIECSGGSIFENLGCYLNNALGNIITQGPLFKPVMNFIEKFNSFIDNTAGLFFRILDILKGDIL